MKACISSLVYIWKTLPKKIVLLVKHEKQYTTILWNMNSTSLFSSIYTYMLKSHNEVAHLVLSNIVVSDVNRSYKVSADIRIAFNRVVWFHKVARTLSIPFRAEQRAFFRLFSEFFSSNFLCSSRNF